MFLLALPLAFPPVASGLMLIYVFGTQFAARRMARVARSARSPTRCSASASPSSSFRARSSRSPRRRHSPRSIRSTPTPRARWAPANGESSRASRCPAAAGSIGAGNRVRVAARDRGIRRDEHRRIPSHVAAGRALRRALGVGRARSARSLLRLHRAGGRRAGGRLDFAPRRRTYDCQKRPASRPFLRRTRSFKELYFLARRFVPGETIESAIAAVRELNARGMSATLDFLGEDVLEREAAIETRDDVHSRCSTPSAQSGVDSNVSVKLTAMGLLVDEDFAFENLLADRRTRRAQSRSVRAHRHGRLGGHRGDAARLRARLRRRTERRAGAASLSEAHRRPTWSARSSWARACGSARAPTTSRPRSRIKAMPEIRANYLGLARELLTRGNYPGIATHDRRLIAAVKEFVAAERNRDATGSSFRCSTAAARTCSARLVARRLPVAHLRAVRNALGRLFLSPRPRAARERVLRALVDILALAALVRAVVQRVTRAPRSRRTSARRRDRAGLLALVSVGVDDDEPTRTDGREDRRTAHLSRRRGLMNRSRRATRAAASCSFRSSRCTATRARAGARRSSRRRRSRRRADLYELVGARARSARLARSPTASSAPTWTVELVNDGR